MTAPLAQSTVRPVQVEGSDGALSDLRRCSTSDSRASTTRGSVHRDEECEARGPPDAVWQGVLACANSQPSSPGPGRGSHGRDRGAVAQASQQQRSGGTNGPPALDLTEKGTTTWPQSETTSTTTVPAALPREGTTPGRSPSAALTSSASSRQRPEPMLEHNDSAAGVTASYAGADAAALIERVQKLRVLLPAFAHETATARREAARLRAENAKLKRRVAELERK